MILILSKQLNNQQIWLTNQFLVLAIFTFAFANGQQCDIVAVDNCAKDVMIFGNRDIVIPTSVLEVDALCKWEKLI